MRKRAFYAVLAAGMIAVSLAGCGKKESESQTENQQTEAVSEKSEETQEQEENDVTQADGTLQIKTASLGEKVAFIDYDSNGTAMQVMLYKGSDGTVRGALNTCQVCAGSPYAYFEQEGNDVVCQNCGNHFTVEEIGDVHGGCNPVPLEVSEDGEEVCIDTAVLDEQADAFQNWKKGI